MFWVAFKGYYGGKAISLGAVEQLEAEAYGMHGYPTEAEAEAKPNVVPAIAKAQVNGWIFNAQGSLTTHAENKAASLLGSGWHLVFGGFSGLLGRILKVAFGGFLIIIGVARMTGAKKTVLEVAKGAVPA